MTAQATGPSTTLTAGWTSGPARSYGYAKRRRYADGRTGWTALYLICEEPRRYASAGTYRTRLEANEAWLARLVERRQGLLSQPRGGRMAFAAFAEEFLGLMTHQKTSTRRGYRYVIRAELVPAFGACAVNEISYQAIARWIVVLRQRGLAASTIRSYKALLSGMLSTAVKLGYIAYNPALKVVTPKAKPRRIKAASGADITSVLRALPGPVSRMLVHLAVQSGCRWGELTELRGGDVIENPDHPDSDYLYVQRAVADAGALDNPLGDGSRFYVEDTTKGGLDRKIGLSVALSRQLRVYVREQRLGERDLLFPASRIRAEWRTANPEAPPVVVPIPDDLGRTPPNASGGTYAHGTMSGYTAGRCKCEWCRRAFAVYRAKRRGAGHPDRPTPSTPQDRRSVNTTDHCPHDWFHRYVWTPALQAADLSRHLTFHDLRHTHATWLARSGKISVQELKERMGHASLDTTQRYIDEADIIDTTAASVIDDILSGSSAPAPRLQIV